MQFDVLSFLSFVLVTTEHAKVLYKLRLVLVNSKGTNITSLELPGCCHANIIRTCLPPTAFKQYFSETRKCGCPVFLCTMLLLHDYAYAGKVELLSNQEVLNTVSGHKRGLVIIGDRMLYRSCIICHLFACHLRIICHKSVTTLVHNVA